jgi:O-antigen/teichoic acid export membrane protein
MVAMRWSVQGIGLVSTVILVRLLSPEDFGLVAMSSLVVSFLTVFTSFGVDMALIQRADVDDAYFNTAWTIRFLQTALVALLVYLLAVPAAAYFDEPRVVSLMQFLSLGLLVGGLENIGIVNFRKELDFGKEFLFMVSTKLISFFITIALALWLRNYWALIWGMVAYRLVSVLLSYGLHPYRPTISLSKFSDLWDFSQWMILRNIGMYIRKQIDTLLISRYFGAGELGLYTVSKEVAELPTTELIWPMARALFPGYAKMSHDPRYLGLAYLKVLNAMCLLCIPAGVGLALVAEPLVLVVFGDEWLPIAPILSTLAIYAVLLTIGSSVQAPLMALGKIKLVTLVIWGQLIVAIPAIAIAVSLGNLEQVALAQVGVSLLTLPLFFSAITGTRIIGWVEILSAIWRPIVSGLIMASCILALTDFMQALPVAELMTKVGVGAISFVVTEVILWIASGRPDGGESALLSWVNHKLFVRD